MKRISSLTLGIALFLASSPAYAAAQEGIAAVVNDVVITTTDIRDRTQLYLSSATEQPSPEQRKQVEKQVLDRLIDETLQVQEAEKFGISVGEGDVTTGFSTLSQKNGLSPEEFRKRLTASGVRLDSLYNQIKADIAWSRVVTRRLRPQLNISESEIDLTLNQIAQGSGKAQYRVAEIFLAVSGAAAENDVHDAVNKVAAQLAQGAPFANVARQFSQAPGAANGGDLGWVQEGQLDPELDKALSQLSPGQVSLPVRSSKGYHIFFMRELRQGKASPATGAVTLPEKNVGPLVTLKQILIPVGEKDPEPVIAAKLARGRALKSEVKSCEEMDKKVKEFPASGDGNIGKGTQNGLPEPLRSIVSKLQIGELSEPIRNPAGIAMLMVCAREETPVAAAQSTTALPKFSPSNVDEETREKVYSQLGMQRLNKMAERYLRDLRATAFIDKRI